VQSELRHMTACADFTPNMLHVSRRLWRVRALWRARAVAHAMRMCMPCMRPP
jgi:hypothetical protein